MPRSVWNPATNTLRRVARRWLTVCQAGVRLYSYFDQGADFQLEAARQALGAVVRLLAEFLQAIAHQPRAFAQVVLEIVFQVFEMAVTQRATKAPDTGFADPQFAGDISGGLKGQLVKIGQHVAGNRPARRGGG